MFWRIPAGLSPSELRNISSGLSLDENNEPVCPGKIQIRKPETKQKKKFKQKKQQKKFGDEGKKRKNADKFAILKELVKNKAESKKMKRFAANSLPFVFLQGLISRASHLVVDGLASIILYNSTDPSYYTTACQKKVIVKNSKVDEWRVTRLLAEGMMLVFLCPCHS